MDLIGDIAGWVGTGFSLIFFISPGISIKDMIQGNLQYSDFPGMLLIVTTLNCIIWITKGYIEKKDQMIYCNGIGAIMSLIWIAFYLYFFSEKNVFKTIGFNVLVYAIIVGLFYVLYYIVHDGDIIGYIAMAVNIIMYFSPGQKILTVIKEIQPKLLPIEISCVAFLNSVAWIIYGIVLKDLSVIITNGVGILLSIMQIAAWGYAKILQKKMVTLGFDNEGEEKANYNSKLLNGNQQKEEEGKGAKEKEGEQEQEKDLEQEEEKEETPGNLIEGEQEKEKEEKPGNLIEGEQEKEKEETPGNLIEGEQEKEKEETPGNLFEGEQENLIVGVQEKEKEQEQENLIEVEQENLIEGEQEGLKNKEEEQENQQEP